MTQNPLSLWPHRGPLLTGASTMAQITAAFAERHGVTVESLKSHSRVRPIARKRQRAYAEIYCTGRYSTSQIGSFFGGRDHSTIAHGIAKSAARAGLPPAQRNYSGVRQDDLGLLSLARALAQQEAAA